MKKRVTILCYAIALLILCALSFVMPRFGLVLTADPFGLGYRYTHTNYAEDGFVRDYYTHPYVGEVKLTYQRFAPIYMLSIADNGITMEGHVMFAHGVQISRDDLADMFEDELAKSAALMLTMQLPFRDYHQHPAKNLGLIALPLVFSAAFMFLYQRNVRYKNLCLVLSIVCGLLAVLQLIRIWDLLRLW